MERASELVEESMGASGGGSGGGGGALGALARTLKQHLRGFGEKVDDARQKFEDAHRCFYLVQKVQRIDYFQIFFWIKILWYKIILANKEFSIS
jgi:hypothetical protein